VRGERLWALAQSEEIVGRDAALTTDAAIAYLDGARRGEDASRPFFLFAHYACTHDPYVRHVDHDFGPTEIDAYDSALAYCDEHVGRLLRALDERDAARTAVVVASDHGELLGEHGMDRHGTSLLEPAMRALLLLRVPGCDVPVVDDAVTLTDVYPTLLALAGGHAGSGARAWSLGAFVFPSRGAPPPPRPAFLYVDDWRAGVHYEAAASSSGASSSCATCQPAPSNLFDLEEDPDEIDNLRRVRLAVHAQLGALLDARRADGERD
jgi:choline-sulfatase